MELARERERELLRQQEEQQRRQEEALAEERRQRARELDEMARAAVHRMVGQGGLGLLRRAAIQSKDISLIAGNWQGVTLFWGWRKCAPRVGGSSVCQTV